jgi:hypothetical protein
LKPFDFSLNYIIQSFYRLSNRKNHETLDYEKNPNAHLIFFSFLSLFIFMKYENIDLYDLNFYGLSITDEINLEFLFKNENENENKLDFLIEFKNLMKKIKSNKFNNDELMKFNFEILGFLDKIKNNFPMEMFKDTRGIINNEIEECMIFFNIFFIFLKSFFSDYGENVK